MLFARKLDDPFGAQVESLRAHRYGVIETAGDALKAIWLRPWPKVVSALEVAWRGERLHQRHTGDRCWLYYNQPRGHSSFLALKYVVSSRDTRLGTFHHALEVLDEVARVKCSDAIVCDAWNLRISARLLARWGWEAHLPSRWHRHFIKRFYGVYPAVPRPRAEVAAVGTLLPFREPQATMEPEGALHFLPGQ